MRHIQEGESFNESAARCFPGAANDIPAPKTPSALSPTVMCHFHSPPVFFFSSLNLPTRLVQQRSSQRRPFVCHGARCQKMSVRVCVCARVKLPVMCLIILIITSQLAILQELSLHRGIEAALCVSSSSLTRSPPVPRIPPGAVSPNCRGEEKKKLKKEAGMNAGNREN